MASVLNTEEFKTSERTLVVAGLPFRHFSHKVLATLVKSYFQDTANGGGAIEAVIYPTRTPGIAFVTFKEKEVAENIRKKRHYLSKRMGAAHLTVCHLSEKVFSRMSAVLDLSVFRGLVRLESLVMGLEQKIPALRFCPLGRRGRVSVQGPFLAFKMLTESLLLEANSLAEKNRKLLSERKKCGRQRLQGPVLKGGRPAAVLRTPAPESAARGETLVLHTDVFLYLKKKCRVYEETLRRFRIHCEERVDGEITTIYLKNAGAGTRPSHAKRVRELIEQFSHDLHFELRKETFVLAGKENKEKRKIQLACEQLRSKYPRVLMNFYETHIDIIGASSDIYSFKREVSGLIRPKARLQPLQSE